MSASGRPASHEIRVEGILDGRSAAWSGGLQVQGAGAQTVISGLLAGQPGLHGLLDKIGALGLCLIPVLRLDPDAPETGGDAAIRGSASSPDTARQPARCHLRVTHRRAAKFHPAGTFG